MAREEAEIVCRLPPKTKNDFAYIVQSDATKLGCMLNDFQQHFITLALRKYSDRMHTKAGTTRLAMHRHRHYVTKKAKSKDGILMCEQFHIEKAKWSLENKDNTDLILLER